VAEGVRGVGMRQTLSVKKRPLIVPEPGQRVRLRTARGRWRGSYRAVSEPFTDEGGVVVLRVAEEEEYRAARREGRRAIGMLWPVGQMSIILPPSGSEEATRELPTRPRQRSEGATQSSTAAPIPCPATAVLQRSPWRRRALWCRVFGD
jgi:hypothetical protein